jgi:hypothetical protein
LLFLSERNWISFASSLDDIEALDRLEWGITGKKPNLRGENNATVVFSSPTEKAPENDFPEDPEELALELLQRLRPPQFKKVIFYYKLINEYDLPDANASQAEKAVEVVRLAVEQEGESLPKLLNTIYRVAPYLKR